MNILLDTHAFIWHIEGSSKLSLKARDTIELLENKLYISIASIWEISIKVGKGKLTLQTSFHDLLDIIELLSIEILPITFADAELYIGLPLHHGDHFDRILVAQAMNQSLVLISCDVAFDAYSIQRLWS